MLDEVRELLSGGGVELVGHIGRGGDGVGLEGSVLVKDKHSAASGVVSAVAGIADGGIQSHLYAAVLPFHIIFVGMAGSDDLDVTPLEYGGEES